MCGICIRWSYKNFIVVEWNESLAKCIFFSKEEADNLNINELAVDLSMKMNAALDKFTPRKTFTIRPINIQGLTEKAKKMMSDRDKTRSKLKDSNLSPVEKQALLMKYSCITKIKYSVYNRPKVCACVHYYVLI